MFVMLSFSYNSAGVLVLVSVALFTLLRRMKKRDGWVNHPFRAMALAKAREGDTKEDFIHELEVRGVAPQVADATYQELQRTMQSNGVRHFPVKPDDSLAEVFNLSLTAWDDADNLDLRFTAKRISENAGRLLPVPWEQLDSDLQPLQTVFDLARWVQRLLPEQ